MRLEDIQVTVQIDVAHANPHAGLLHAILTERGARGQTNLCECPVFIVSEKQAGRRVASYVNIWPTCIVKIRCDRSHAVTSGSLADSRFVAYIFERSVTVVAIQIAAPHGKAARPAIHRNPL